MFFTYPPVQTAGRPVDMYTSRAHKLAGKSSNIDESRSHPALPSTIPPTLFTIESRRGRWVPKPAFAAPAPSKGWSIFLAALVACCWPPGLNEVLTGMFSPRFTRDPQIHPEAQVYPCPGL